MNKIIILFELKSFLASEKKKTEAFKTTCHFIGELAQLKERRTGTPFRQVRFTGAVRGFAPRIN